MDQAMGEFMGAIKRDGVVQAMAIAYRLKEDGEEILGIVTVTREIIKAVHESILLQEVGLIQEAATEITPIIKAGIKIFTVVFRSNSGP